MNSKVIAVIAVAIAVCCISVPIIMMTQNHDEQTNTDTPSDTKTMDKVLLVYFSATGVTDTMALAASPLPARPTHPSSPSR